MDRTDWIESRILFGARKNGFPEKTPHTFLYDLLQGELKDSILNVVGEQSIGRPVLVIADSPDCWTVLGTEMIASFRNQVLLFFDLNTLSSVDLARVNSKGHSVEQIAQRKAEWDLLLLTSEDGHQETIWCHRGGEFYMLMGILLKFPFS